MGNEQSSENERRKRDANIQATLEKALEKQRQIYEQRCRQMFQHRTESLLQQRSSNTSGGTSPVGTSRDVQNYLYPNLQTCTSTEPSPYAFISASFVRDDVMRQRNIRSTNDNPPIAPSVNNTTRVTPSAPLLTSIEPFNVSRVQSNSELGTELNCPKCGNQFGLNIYQCGGGHSSCRDCRMKGGLCGVLNCGKMITDRRNRTLEAYMADLMSIVNQQTVNNSKPQVNQPYSQSKRKCPNHSDGCKLNFTLNEMHTHLRECLFNEIACPLLALFGSCSWRGKFNQLDQHFADCHPQHRGQVDSEMTIVSTRNDKRIFYLVLMGSFNFFIHLKIDTNAKLIYLAAQLVGTAYSASKWHYEFHIYNKAQPKRKFQYIDVCKSNSVAIEDVFINKQCAVIPIEYIDSFVKQNCLNYKFFLKKQIKTTTTKKKQIFYNIVH